MTAITAVANQSSLCRHRYSNNCTAATTPPLPHANAALIPSSLQSPIAALTPPSLQSLLWPTNPHCADAVTAIIALPPQPQSLHQHCRDRCNSCINAATTIAVANQCYRCNPSYRNNCANTIAAAIPAPTLSTSPKSLHPHATTIIAPTPPSPHANAAIAAIAALTPQSLQSPLWPTNPHCADAVTAIIAPPLPPQSLHQHC